MKIVSGGVTAAKGFVSAAAAAGIKYQNRDDMALIFSETPCVAAGVFTKNVAKAAPVKYDRELIDRGYPIHAIVVNSGVANACTGSEGMKACEETAKEAAKLLDIPENSVAVASTGVIGKQIPTEKIKAGIALLAADKGDSDEHARAAANAILTTDTHKKEIAVEFLIGNQTVTIGGMAKGSGMIHPNMCTMLSFITTDAYISKEALQKALSADTENTYNMISVDGDTSTNDTVLLLANGLAGNPIIEGGTPEYGIFLEALNLVDTFLAKSIAGDGEGATALLTVTATGCSDLEQSKLLAKAVVCSDLTKTAIAGHDANWGRILCAMGYSGAEFDPEKVDIYIESNAGSLKIVEDGTATNYSEEKATEILSESEVLIRLGLQEGTAKATAWGCDLTHGYIDINADYRS
jgi:glutamate N-acetyltransferase/amino-acid N-acetyltransferase